MSVEAYSVSFEKTNFHAPIPDTFNPEFVYKLRENAIKENLLSYAGEYRLGVKFDEYFYREERDPLTGESYLASNEPGPIKNIYRKAIENRLKNGLSVKREVAECLGFEKLEKELLNSPDGTMALWISPPGEEKDGYGGYSFTFIAQVKENEQGRAIRMIPYRNEKTLLEHSDYLSKVTGKDVVLKSDTEALASPYLIKRTDEIRTPEDLLNVIGEKEKLDTSWKEDLEQKAWPFLQVFLYLVKTNAPDADLIKARNAFENFALAYKKDRSIRLHELNLNEEKTIHPYYLGIPQLDKWGDYEPPKVSGSCGLAGEDQKQNSVIPMEFQKNYGTLQKDRYGERTFNCPSCKKENVRPYNTLLPRCQHCNSTEVAC